LIKTIKDFKFSIAIDGGAASGKSTASKMIAKHFNFKLLNSGRLYRFLAFSMIKDKKNLKDKKYLKKISENISISKLNKTKLDEQNVSYLASKIAKNKYIRKLLRDFQKKFSKNKRFIIEGRDIGSIILPNADLKIFFSCSLNEKTKRRYNELKKINPNTSFEKVKNAIKKRDFFDKNRKESPLLFVKGSVLVVTTNLSIKKMRLKLIKLVRKAIKKKYGNL
tara:strand:+ start:101 stop:766 length:666 start_codon:yes stop_codon:yes gene_type:complete